MLYYPRWSTFISCLFHVYFRQTEHWLVLKLLYLSMGPDFSSAFEGFLIRLASLKFFSSFCSVELRIFLSRPTRCLEQYCNVKETSASVFPSRILLYLKTVDLSLQPIGVFNVLANSCCVNFQTYTDFGNHDLMKSIKLYLWFNSKCVTDDGPADNLIIFVL